MFEFVDILAQKRRSLTVVSLCILPLLCVSLLAQVVQTHQADMTAWVKDTQANQSTPAVYDDANAVTGALSNFAANSGQTLGTAKINLLRGVMAAADGTTRFDRAILHGMDAAASATLHGVARTVTATAGFIGDSWGFTGHMIANTLGFVAGVSHVGALIRSPDRTLVPTITRMRAEQASIIQSGTTAVAVAAITNGSGGACDVGEGNGSYPLAWCDAPMDAVQTIAYSADRINRECTSYAFWYFASVEGHSDFRVSGNAKYWAATSNYPTHVTPAVGAIGVETGGSYGHVVIVQALPGQTYQGQVVPDGNVLVSEMNYDWQGHFRYSFSPLGKFTAFIYPEV